MLSYLPESSLDFFYRDRYLPFRKNRKNGMNFKQVRSYRKIHFLLLISLTIMFSGSSSLFWSIIAGNAVPTICHCRMNGDRCQCKCDFCCHRKKERVSRASATCMMTSQPCHPHRKPLFANSTFKFTLLYFKENFLLPTSIIYFPVEQNHIPIYLGPLEKPPRIFQFV